MSVFCTTVCRVNYSWGCVVRSIFRVFRTDTVQTNTVLLQGEDNEELIFITCETKENSVKINLVSTGITVVHSVLCYARHCTVCGITQLDIFCLVSLGPPASFYPPATAVIAQVEKEAFIHLLPARLNGGVLYESTSCCVGRPWMNRRFPRVLQRDSWQISRDMGRGISPTNFFTLLPTALEMSRLSLSLA